jgi:hypothetical protein
MSPVAGERAPQYAGDVRSLCDRVRALLDRERQRLHEEIRAYPTPIPRCDQQFNALIGRREQLFAESARLEAAAAASGDHEVEALLAFVDSSCCIDDESKRRLRTALSEGSMAGERRSGASEAEASSGHESMRSAD